MQDRIELDAIDDTQANPPECYPIGTIVSIETERAVFLLLAVSEFDERGNAHASRKDIESAILALLKHYDQKGQGADLYLPLIGTGMSRAGLTCSDSYQLIQRVVTSGEIPICGKITIVVRDESTQDIGFAI